MLEVTAAAARRTAVAAQGFADRRPAGTATRRHVLRAVDRTALLQIDSVAVAVRAHYMPVFSRIGAYDREVLDAAAWRHSARAPRALVEYWAHEAALIPVEDWPLMRWRMRRYTGGRWAGERRVLERNPALGRDILDVITSVGAASAGEIEKHLQVEPSGGRGPWWGRSDVKVVCEQLFAAGELSVDRRVAFSRYYDLAERVLPADALAARIDEEDAVRELLRRSARALGIATVADLRDYYRLSAGQTRPAVADLVDEGTLVPAAVRGWNEPAYLYAGMPVPRRARGTALLCPFDPLVFHRPRTERIFGFRYRLEIYTPEHKRVHGYYVYPFLLDGELVARADLKADRAKDALCVPGAFVEEGADVGAVAEALAGELRVMADWLGLSDVVVGERGDLAAKLAAQM
ncbi:winged helix-turn-helix domain-containing protein [Rhodococcus artemisiae]|uniref:Crosslink repair DNA glycosylase YcaQ family protein n=1 Tax=Rhodococcus artemisiae TaxID=714159 RepID=A0ABU7L6X3_9NOCA|nr:crosslink repair DNA glycosylase YcaQ family protein [Rhodococcus artemisiae]MEE2057097.1 crosslink repair DNA glycosylase YcaQ family protein [Rhodococcus artemisiae]